MLFGGGQEGGRRAGKPHLYAPFLLSSIIQLMPFMLHTMKILYTVSYHAVIFFFLIILVLIYIPILILTFKYAHTIFLLIFISISVIILISIFTFIFISLLLLITSSYPRSFLTFFYHIIYPSFSYSFSTSHHFTLPLGTENVALIAGLGAASQLAYDESDLLLVHMLHLKLKLILLLKDKLSTIKV
jgi:hypothetical protein